MSLPVDRAFPTENLANEPPQMHLSLPHKMGLLFMFSFTNLLDIINNSVLIPAIPALEKSTGITQSQSAWIISAFQLTFASFLLISGRISDIYSPKKAFFIGVLSLGIVSFGAGFVNNKILILVLRAFMGIASAMSIPSALALLVRVFPEPLAQARAIGVFGGCGALGNVLGLFIGAVLVHYASYHWIFWFVAIAVIPIALGCLFIIPAELAKSRDVQNVTSAKWKSLDLIGVSILTVAPILFIYAVTSGPTSGWATPGVLTPLIISILLICGFFYWENLVPFENAAIPPRTWFYDNISVLSGSALFPLLWWNAIFLVFTTLWQDVFHWTVVSVAIHMLPIGMTGLVSSFSGALSGAFSSKWIILFGYSMVAVATLLLAVGCNRPEDYGPYIFPAFVFGSSGAMLAFTHTNIAIFRAAPASMAGTVGAIFNGALQFGSAIGLATFNSIQTSVEGTSGKHGYRGRSAAFLFLLGVTLVEIVFISYFYRDDAPQPELELDERPRVQEQHGGVDHGRKADRAVNDTTAVVNRNDLPV